MPIGRFCVSDEYRDAKAFCRRAFTPAQRGRPQLYCSRSHRQRAYETRRAYANVPSLLLGRDIDAMRTKAGIERAVVDVLRKLGLLAMAISPRSRQLAIAAWASVSEDYDADEAIRALGSAAVTIIGSVYKDDPPEAHQAVDQLAGVMHAVLNDVMGSVGGTKQ